MAFKKKSRGVVGFNPITNAGDMGAAIGDSSLAPQPMGVDALGNPPTVFKRPQPRPTHPHTVVPKFPTQDRKATYRKR